jgi:hypothetical protein
LIGQVGSSAFVAADPGVIFDESVTDGCGLCEKISLLIHSGLLPTSQRRFN